MSHPLRIRLVELAERDPDGSLTAAVGDVLASGRFLLGSRLEALEVALARSCSVRRAVGVGSGTDALALGLTALGIGPGDEVIVPAFGAFPTAAAVVAVGARPVLVDVEDDRPHLDRDAALAALGPRTRAVILVHLYGIPADAEGWRSDLEPRGIHLIEDVAQAQGALLGDGRPAGSVGTFGALSFYPTKNLGAAGDGGAVLTDDVELAERIVLLRNHGIDGDHHLVAARNSRLDEVQAAILALRLADLGTAIERRRAVSDRYASSLPLDARYVVHGPGGAPHLAVVRPSDPDGLLAHLARMGIESRRHYPVPIPSQPPFAGDDHAPHPSARRWAEQALSLPLHPGIALEQVDEVSAAVHDHLHRSAGPTAP
ncbi:DegT/DnrJ/EryC1/StrS family aminotransferase [Aquihabitans daechungensis]|uniref:DegT/DnrJ/EryC1/StrS family aminotransferase n=1 Tax=Aquihabitans daechungensis TaxID=1052257 RepID=UPI003B9E9175